MILKSKIRKNHSKGYSVLSLVLMVVTIVFAAFTIVHPRPYRVCMLLLLIYFVVDTRKKSKKESHKDHPAVYLVTVPFCLLFVMMFTSVLSVFYPGHMPWEYKEEIANYKNEYRDSYYYFPDDYPNDATNKKWIDSPGYLQGTAFRIVIFNTNKDYINDIIEKYANDVEKSFMCVDGDGNKLFRAGTYRYIEEDRRAVTKVYILNETNRYGDIRKSGFFVDEEKGTIGFFSE